MNECMVNDIYQQERTSFALVPSFVPSSFRSRSRMMRYSMMCGYIASASVVLNQVYGIVVLMDSHHTHQRTFVVGGKSRVFIFDEPVINIIYYTDLRALRSSFFSQLQAMCCEIRGTLCWVLGTGTFALDM